MTKKISLAAITLFASVVSAGPAYANGNHVETRYFSADIVNVRRAQTGNVIVTIKFSPKIDDSERLYIYSDISKTYKTGEAECPENNTILIDGDGEEHTAQNCLPPFDDQLASGVKYTNGMQIHSGSDAFFVYKFGLASASKEALQNINLTIPMHYNHCVPNTSIVFGYTCSPSVMTLSFYGVSAN
jgi:hypothetical protein